MKWLFFIFSTLALMVQAQEATLENYQKTFAQKQKALVEQYGKDLDSALKSAKKNGDFDNYLIIESEKKRFDLEKTVAQPSQTKTPYETATLNYRQSLIKLYEHYIKALDDFVKKSLMSNRIEDAKAGKIVKDETSETLVSLTGHQPVQPVKPVIEPKDPEEKSPFPAGSIFSTYAKDLVLYYAFDNKSPDSVDDKSPKQNHGSAEGAQFLQDGKVGGAASFNGSRARIVVSAHESLLMGAGACTIGGWIKSYGRTHSYQSIFTKGSNPGYAFRLTPAPDRAIEYFKSAGGQYAFFTSKQTIKDSEWHHLVVVDQGNGGVEFYMDGQFLERVKKQNFNTDTPEGAAVGALANTIHRQWFNGMIDELFVLKRALTKSEIKRLYEQQQK